MFVAKRLDMRHNAISNILYVVVGYRKKRQQTITNVTETKNRNRNRK